MPNNIFELLQKRILHINLFYTKKLTTVLATFTLITTSLKALEKIFCIQYQVKFLSKSSGTLANSDGELYAMTLDFATKLELIPKIINVGKQKIISTQLQMYGMITAVF